MNPAAHNDPDCRGGQTFRGRVFFRGKLSAVILPGGVVHAINLHVSHVGCGRVLFR